MSRRYSFGAAEINALASALCNDTVVNGSDVFDGVKGLNVAGRLQNL